MLEFRTTVQQIPSVLELFDLVYASVSNVLNENNSFSDAGAPVVRCPELELGVAQFEEGLSFYIPICSSRATVVTRTKSEIAVMVFPLASRTDFFLALKILEALRNFGAHTVEAAELGQKIGFDFLEKTFTPEFHRIWNRDCLRQLMVEISNNPDAHVLLDGPLQAFCFGQLIKDILDEFSDENDRLEVLIEMMVRKQHWFMRNDFEGVELADVQEYDDGSTTAFVPLDQPVVVQKADFYSFVGDDEVVYTMPRQQFFDEFCPGDKFQIMDEFEALLHVTKADLNPFYSRKVLLL